MSDSQKVVLTISLLIIAVGFLVPGPEEKVVFLDIGQGDAIFLQDKTRQVLIDGGQGTTVLQRLAEEMPWFDRTIETVIATHADRDHLEGLLHVLERYDVQLVLLPKMSHTSQLQEAWLSELQALLESQQVEYRFGWQGQRLKVSEELTLDILGPFSEGGAIVAPGKKTNNGAVLTKVEFHDFVWLLTSDAEAAVERKLVQTYVSQPAALGADILKAGHHGSKTSTTPELLAAASPSGVVISVGQDNRYGHPHPTVLDRLEKFKTWRTDRDGSVRFTYSNGKWLLTTRSH